MLDSVEAAQTIAAWQYREWGQYEAGVTLVNTEEWARDCINSRQIPSAFVCYVDELVGRNIFRYPK